MAGQKQEKDKQGFCLSTEIYEWFEAIVFSVTVVILVFTFIFRIVGVDGGSMVPTLHNEDRVILTNLFYEPKAGDIVVCALPDRKPIIKRIIAMEGQSVDINYETDQVFVDGKELDQSYINEADIYPPNGADVQFPITVPPGQIFVMGDNRNHSLDSRASVTGTIDKRYILGKAIFRIFPFNAIGPLGNEYTFVD